jgi:ribosomal 50S subunit-recycling heat shock protein
MRLDLFLKVSRLVARRSLAQQFCDSGLVTVNGIQAKASKEIRSGDEIELKRRSRSTLIEVVEIPGTKQVSKAGAGSLYRVIKETREESDLD